MTTSDDTAATNESLDPNRGFQVAVDHLLNNISEIFAIIDVDGRVRRANIAYRRLSGPAGGAHDASIIQHLDQGQHDACRDVLRSLNREKSEQFMRLQFKSGRDMRLVDVTFIWLGVDGLISMVGRDCTEKDGQERERLESSAARDAIEQVTEIGHWRVGADLTVKLTPGATRILGLDSTAPSPHLSELRDMIGATEYARVEKLIHHAISKRRPFKGNLSITRIDGSQRVVTVAGAPSLTARGQVEAMHGVVVDKTDAEAALRQALNSDSLVRQFVASAPMPMAMFDRDYRLMIGSGAFFEGFQIDHETSVSKDLRDLCPWIPDKWWNALGQTLKGETAQFDCDSYSTPRGNPRWARWSSAPWRNGEGEVGGFVVVCEDVTQSVQVQHRIEASKERMDFGLSISSIMVWELDFEHREISVEGDWKQLFPENPTFDAITGNVDWIHEADRDMLGSKWRAHLAGGPPYSAEYRVTLSDGQEIWHGASYRILKTVKGSPARAFAVIQDISDRKAIEVKAQEAEQRALIAGAAKSDFLSNMSHEIRTPLNGVLAVSEMLGRSHLDDKQREMVKLISSSGETLLRVMDDLVEFSKLEADQIEFEVRPFDLEDTLRRAAEGAAARAENKGLQFECFISASIDGIYRGDPNRLTQILSNLLNNAVKFTDEGRIGLSASVEERGGRSYCKIVVEDTGIGFSEEVAARIFDRFEQADLSTSRKYGGLGLGLSIVKRLVEGMEGELSVDSKEGEGSRFEVRIPIARDRIAALGSINAVQIEDFDAETTLDNIRLLVAEDNPMNRRVVELLMAQSNVKITFAENGKEAVEIFQRGHFDLVLMDLQMPVMGGLQATREIRAWEKETGRVSTPLVALSANATDDHVQEAKEAGADDHVAKPIVREVLFETIARYARPGARGDADEDSDEFDLDGEDFDLDEFEVAV